MINRFDILDSAKELTGGDRNRDYGDPKPNHWDIAAIWSVILGEKLQPGERVEAREVALCMAGVKIARLKTSPMKRDSYDDAAAYIAIAGECAEIPEDQ